MSAGMRNLIDGIIASVMNAPLQPLAPDVEGMTSQRVRHLLHRFVSCLAPHQTYLEIGCYRGATLISALLDQQVRAFACDKWSASNSADDNRRAFWANIKKYSSRLPKPIIRDMDCWELAKEKDPFNGNKISIYFYDGDHTAHAHYDAVLKFCRFWSSQLIYIVDDWNHPTVRRGTWYGMHEIRPQHLDFRELSADRNGDTKKFWNGVGVFYLETNKPWDHSIKAK